MDIYLDSRKVAVGVVPIAGKRKEGGVVDIGGPMLGVVLSGEI